MIQKNITLEEYVKRLTNVLLKSEILFRGDNESKRCKEQLMKTEAEMFFETFGEDISQKMQQAFDLELEETGNEEYYKVLVIFFTKIGSENTRQFLGYLSLAKKDEE